MTAEKKVYTSPRRAYWNSWDTIRLPCVPAEIHPPSLTFLSKLSCPSFILQKNMWETFLTTFHFFIFLCFGLVVCDWFALAPGRRTIAKPKVCCKNVKNFSLCQSDYWLRGKFGISGEKQFSRDEVSGNFPIRENYEKTLKVGTMQKRGSKWGLASKGFREHIIRPHSATYLPGSFDKAVWY